VEYILANRILLFSTGCYYLYAIRIIVFIIYTRYESYDSQSLEGKSIICVFKTDEVGQGGRGKGEVKMSVFDRTSFNL